MNRRFAVLALLAASWMPFVAAQSAPAPQPPKQVSAAKVPLGPGDKLGTVKWFNDAKGYGFISPDDKSADVFVHFAQIQMSGFKTLKPGEKVVYQVQTGPKGTVAVNVRPR